MTTAGRVVVSTLFGSYADRRFLEAMEDSDGGPPEIFDYSDRDSLVLDYVADTGDGWDSTYAVAYHLAQEQLEVEGADEPLPRGEVLVLGGDEVYPTPQRGEYERRLVGPFETAFAWSEPPAKAPHLFALPGNHDWYDGLTSFYRLFINKRWFGGWRLPQRRSYFALKLPHNWWLVATDMQLGSDIDEGQVKYFERVAREQMNGDAKVLLCTAEPHWVYEGEWDRGHWKKPHRPSVPENCDEPPRSNLDYLERTVFKNAAIKVMVAGDLHHYRRHEDPQGRQKITSGGGGAFLHPTHAWSRRTLAGGFACLTAWPSVKASRGMTWWNLAFPFLHPRFGLATGAIYLLLSWATMVNLSDNLQWRTALRETFGGVLMNPAAAFIAMGILAGFVFFADPGHNRFRIPAGLLHGLAHLGACFLIGWGVTYATVQPWWIYPGLPFQTPLQLLLSGALIFLGGGLLGPVILGCYLLISSYLGRHWNESFSSLSVPDWKHFLRIRVDATGLTIYPIGLRTVPRRWRPSDTGDPTKPRLEPDDPKASKPALIEAPIHVPGRSLRERVVPFQTEDHRELRLTQIRGEQEPTLGPVLLVHGAGVRSNIFRAPVEENLVDRLVKEGFEVWLEDWRASIDLTPCNWTLDQAARYDHPAAVATVLRETGATTLKAVIHCQGSTSFTMAAVAGLLPEVDTIVSNAVSLVPVIPKFAAFKLKWTLPLLHRMTDHLNPQWGERTFGVASWLIRSAALVVHRECDNGVCRMVSFTYGAGFPALWRHENLNPATHEWLRGEFARVPLTFFDQIRQCVAAGGLRSVETLPDLPKDFLTAPLKTGARWTFLAGERNRCFLPESQALAFAHFERQQPQRHRFHLLPGYGHLDVFMGERASQEVFPLIVQALRDGA